MGRLGGRVAEETWVAKLAWPLCVLGILAAFAVLFLDYLDRSSIRTLDQAQPIGVVLGISFSILGALIVARQPGNRIGWIYLLIGVATALQALTAVYYERGVFAPGLPGARWSAWTSNWTTFPVFPTGLALFAFLLFPSGRLSSPRWRPVSWAAVIYTAVVILLGAFQPGKLSVVAGLPTVKNPLGIAALGTSSTAVSDISYAVGDALLAVVIGGLLVRGSRSRNVQERQQVKLLAYSAAVTVTLIVVMTAIYLAGVGVSNSFWDLPIVLGFGIAVPVACGVAILRHGLYEIDRLIRRTLSYALLSGALAAVFVGLVLLTTRVLPFSSPVGVAASTLVAAALFRPLRVRLQRLVDRRFNRSHYNAEALVAAFSARLRNAADLDTVRGSLLEAAHHAVEPTHLSVWLRDDPSR